VSSAIVGDNIGFLLGRHFGRELAERPGLLHKHRVRAIAAGDRFFKRHGAKTVFIGRWVALIRVATAWLAGINGMRMPTFFFWNAFGAITWGVTYGLVGYYGGKGAANVLSSVGLVGAGVLVAVLIGGYVFVEVRSRRAAR
jgi:membrane protein DedA with SNARE-associated domain